MCTNPHSAFEITATNEQHQRVKVLRNNCRRAAIAMLSLRRYNRTPLMRWNTMDEVCGLLLCAVYVLLSLKREHSLFPRASTSLLSSVLSHVCLQIRLIAGLIWQTRFNADDCWNLDVARTPELQTDVVSAQSKEEDSMLGTLRAAWKGFFVKK
jgi:hypothetical protein